MSDHDALEFRPDPSPYVWTFGGAAPIARVRAQFAVAVEEDDAVAEKVLALFGVAADHRGEVAGVVGCIGAGRAGGTW